jgi:hypothetical protein
VLIKATGCVNLERVSRLTLRRAFRRISAAQRDELAAATARGVAVAA